MDFSRKRVFRVKGQSIRSKRASANCELLFGAKCSSSVYQHAASLRTLCKATPLCSINIYYHHQLKFQSTLFNLSNKEVQRKYKKVCWYSARGIELLAFTTPPIRVTREAIQFLSSFFPLPIVRSGN